METITNAVSSATAAVSNAIYGAPPTGNETGGVEPVNARVGSGTADDPYDKGNDASLNPSTGPTSSTTTATSATDATPSSASVAHTDTNPTSASTSQPSSATTGAHTTESPTVGSSTVGSSTTGSSSAGTHSSTMGSSAPSTGIPGLGTSSSDNASPAHGISGAGSSSGPSGAPTSAPSVTGSGPIGQSRPDAGSRPGDIRPTEANENRPNVNVGGFGTAEPSVSADPASGAQPTFKQQGADKPLDEPTGEQNEAIREEKKEGEQIQKKPSNEEERVQMAERGELPKDPNDHSGEPMHMHGGPEEGKGGETDRKKSIGQEGGQPHGSAKGTGEEWVKTSGVAADGGDFDATKPGAGREATRLLEEKGIHHDPNERGPVDDSSASGPQKTSKISKLKEKLHIGTGKNLEGNK